MSSKYMDFVPSRATKTTSNFVVQPKPKAANQSKVVAKPKAAPVKPQVKKEDDGEAVLGVIEDLGVRKDSTVVEPEKKVAETKESSKTFKVPKTPFINQEKVVKRPLSKNIYQKKVVVPEEVPKGPVTIIAKPEKDAHVSLVVAVILTIILGAAAGTVAFLLLPKG